MFLRPSQLAVFPFRVTLGGIQWPSFYLDFRPEVSAVHFSQTAHPLRQHAKLFHMQMDPRALCLLLSEGPRMAHVVQPTPPAE